MIVVMAQIATIRFVLTSIVVMIVFAITITEVVQGHAGQVLHRHLRFVAAAQYARQEGLHVRADPVQQVGVTHAPYVGWAQCIVMR